MNATALRDLKQDDMRAEKQLSAMCLTMALLTASDFNAFEDSVKRFAYMYNWPDYILDLDGVAPAEPNDNDKRHLKNAYMLIMDRCQGHLVANLLKGVPMGDALQAWKTVYRYHHKDTVAGRSNATMAFYGATMANTNSNVVEWIALVETRAKRLSSAGGTPTESDKLGTLLQGMLPEFKSVVTILHATPDLTYSYASGVITDFASTNNLTEFVKGGQRANDRVFYAQDSERTEQPSWRAQDKDNGVPPGPRRGQPKDQLRNRSTDCWAWATERGCMHGKECIHKHTGQGKFAPDVIRFDLHPSFKKEYFALPRSGSKDAKREMITSRLHPPTGMPPSDIHVLDASSNRTTPMPQGSPAPRRAVPTSRVNNSIFSCMVCKSYTHSHRNCPAATVMTLDDPVLNAQASSTGGGLPSLLSIFSMLIMALYFLLKTMTSGIQHLVLGDRKTTMLALTFFCMLMVMAVDAAHPDISAHIASNATISKNLAYQCFTQNHNTISNDSQKSNIDSCDDFEWCIDSGCNRFVTNDMHDFIPGSVKHNSTNVSVGNGNTISPCTGSVVIHSIPHDTNIQCDNVLFMPQCKKEIDTCYSLHSPTLHPHLC